MRDSRLEEDAGPLSGITILVTRAADQASRLTKALTAEGASIVELPSIRIEQPLSWEPLDQAIQRAGYAWVVLTSVNAVRFFFDRLRVLGKGANWFAATRVAAIGPETARALAATGVPPALVPDEYVAEVLLGELLAAAPLRGKRILLPQADIARDALALGLEAEGAIVDRVPVYRTLIPEAPRNILEDLRRGEIAAVSFTSSSTVRNLTAMLGPDASALRGMVVACIGPVTASTARAAGLEPHIVATTSTIPGLVAAIRAYYVQKQAAQPARGKR